MTFEELGRSHALRSHRTRVPPARPRSSMHCARRRWNRSGPDPWPRSLPRPRPDDWPLAVAPRPGGGLQKSAETEVARQLLLRDPGLEVVRAREPDGVGGSARPQCRRGKVVPPRQHRPVSRLLRADPRRRTPDTGLPATSLDYGINAWAVAPAARLRAESGRTLARLARVQRAGRFDSGVAGDVAGHAAGRSRRSVDDMKACRWCDGHLRGLRGCVDT
jgi:hypothetical protein